MPIPHRTARLRSVGRLLLLGAHFLQGWLQLHVLFRRVPMGQQRPRVQAWCERLFRISGVSLAVQGSVPAGGPMLLVANHVSWLDMIVLQSLLPCRFIAKAEVRHWPLIGTMASRCRTLYIDRSAPRATAAVTQAMAHALGEGDTLVLFAEGTTSDGTTILPFRASLLQGAIDAPAEVLPVALRYLDDATLTVSRNAAFANDDTLLGAMWRALGRDVTVQVAFGEALASEGRHRRALATELHSQVASLHATRSPCGLSGARIVP